MSPATTFVVQYVRSFTGDEAIENGYLFVKDGTIASLGQGPPPASLANVVKISKPGHTLLPGFIDCDVHAYLGDERCMSTSLQFGITTVLDMHNEPDSVDKLKKLASAEDNFSIYADLKSSRLSASISGGYPFKLITDIVGDAESLEAAKSWVKLKGPEEAEAYIKQRIAEGSDYIKLLATKVLRLAVCEHVAAYHH
jgi:hypothetical protein